MSKKITSIERAILTLDAGTFQKLCDEILLKKYPNFSIECLGSQAGSEKTTKGTPDTFFIIAKENLFLLNIQQKLVLHQK